MREVVDGGGGRGRDEGGDCAESEGRGEGGVLGGGGGRAVIDPRNGGWGKGCGKILGKPLCCYYVG